MAWLEIHQTFPNHRKTLHLAALLKIPVPHAMGLMTSFWLWALDNAPSGSLEKVFPLAVAVAAQWNGDPEELVSAMRDAEYLELIDSVLFIRNWEEYAGKLIKGRQRSTERMRAWREKKKEDEPNANDTHSDTVTCASRSEDSTVQYSTVQKDIKPSSSSGDDESSPPSHQKDVDLEDFLSKAFPVFWQEYPRKVGKREAEKAFRALFKACPKGKRADLMKGIADHLYDYIDTIEAKGTAMEYVKHPATWLRAIDFFEPPVKEAL
ncbi:MAG: hypothetical protein EOM93_07505 [Gammaproteobacteria bacterium]|nr:hypothetical protein [Gammaproteobacteria bacterium]